MNSEFDFRDETKRLCRALTARAEGRDQFIASAFAAWRRGGSATLEVVLRCDQETLWRIGLANKPISGPHFANEVRKLAEAFAVDANGLVRILRHAQVGARWNGESAGEGVLKAALDRDNGGNDKS